MQFEDTADVTWTFFHNPKWDIEFPAVYACEIRAGNPNRYGFLLWRDRIWIIEDFRYPIWAPDIPEWPVSREVASKVFPEIGLERLDRKSVV
jgi:hypothetical protein